MSKNRKNNSKLSSRHGGYNKMRARTERMKLGVRCALCCFLLTASLAFLASTLKPYRELGKQRAYYKEDILEQERLSVEKVDQKEREYHAIESDPNYLGLIARDRLNYYEPGEKVFRIER